MIHDLRFQICLKHIATTFLAAVALSLGSWNVCAQNAFSKSNLVSDIAGLAANMDTNLVNPWSIVSSNTGPFCVADNGTGRAPQYDGNGALQSSIITVP